MYEFYPSQSKMKKYVFAFNPIKIKDSNKRPIDIYVL